MPAQPFVLDPTRLHLLSISTDLAGITLHLRTCSDTACCPQCGCPSARVHSRYRRLLADLPWVGIPVRMLLWSRRFFCATPECPRRIFTERLPGIARPHARRTERLRDWLQQIAFAVGGEPGARVLRRLGISVCGDTLLAHIRSYQMAEIPSARILSVDDFAFRRGRSYGSILVDLERHHVIDLLPDRSGIPFASWLAAHPGVQVLSRDRSSEYARAARRVAPQAVQIADRFHLIHNLREVLFRLFRRHSRLLRQVTSPRRRDGQPESVTHWRLDREASHARDRAAMEERFSAIHHLANQGMSTMAIARMLGLNRQTVAKYRLCTTPPQRRVTRRQSSTFLPYQEYVLHRWANGCHNARTLWREIVAQGFPGSYRTVARLTGYLKHQEWQGVALPLASRGITPRQAAGLVAAHPEKRTPGEEEALHHIGSLHPHLRIALELFASFAALVRGPPNPAQAAEELTDWMGQARATGVPELKAFAAKLGQDRDAVVAALTHPHSQGQTEGFITKLKLLKRSMYGRANFDLLRARVLYAAR
jgi:transposase